MKQRYAEFMVLLTSDKRKAAALSVLLLVALVLLLRMMLTGKPATVVASTPSGAVSGSSDHAGNEDPTGLVEFELAPLVILPRTEPMTRDLFAPGPEFVRQPLQPDQSGASGPKSAQGSDDNSPVSPELRRLELERLVREEASRLHLSSTMIGANPIVVIQHDGSKGAKSVLRVGDAIAGFEIIEISARSAVLRKNGIRVKINIGGR